MKIRSESNDMTKFEIAGNCKHPCHFYTYEYSVIKRKRGAIREIDAAFENLISRKVFSLGSSIFLWYVKTSFYYIVYQLHLSFLSITDPMYCVSTGRFPEQRASNVF